MILTDKDIVTFPEATFWRRQNPPDSKSPIMIDRPTTWYLKHSEIDSVVPSAKYTECKTEIQKKPSQTTDRPPLLARALSWFCCGKRSKSPPRGTATRTANPWYRRSGVHFRVNLERKVEAVPSFTRNPEVAHWLHASVGQTNEPKMETDRNFGERKSTKNLETASVSSSHNSNPSSLSTLPSHPNDLFDWLLDEVRSNRVVASGSSQCSSENNRANLREVYKTLQYHYDSYLEAVRTDNSRAIRKCLPLIQNLAQRFWQLCPRDENGDPQFPVRTQASVPAHRQIRRSKPSRKDILLSPVEPKNPKTMHQRGVSAENIRSIPQTPAASKPRSLSLSEISSSTAWAARTLREVIGSCETSERLELDAVKEQWSCAVDIEPGDWFEGVLESLGFFYRA